MASKRLWQFVARRLGQDRCADQDFAARIVGPFAFRLCGHFPAVKLLLLRSELFEFLLGCLNAPFDGIQQRAWRGCVPVRREIVDERTGTVHDCTRKRSVEHTELILPGNRSAGRAEFWNHVALHHMRGVAVVSHEIEVALEVEVKTLQE